MALFRPDPPQVVGLLGGVAAGKSTVAAVFADRGLAVLDADEVAREVVEIPEVAAALRLEFGAGVFGPDGSLDRKALAERVFRDPEARRRLQDLTHPQVRQRLLEELENLRAAGTSTVLDVPLLFEGGLVDACDRVVFVAASEDLREARARARGWAAGERARREAAQEGLEQKMARADAIIRNESSRREIADQVDALLAQWRVRPGDAAPP